MTKLSRLDHVRFSKEEQRSTVKFSLPNAEQVAECVFSTPSSGNAKVVRSFDFLCIVRTLHLTFAGGDRSLLRRHLLQVRGMESEAAGLRADLQPALGPGLLGGLVTYGHGYLAHQMPCTYTLLKNIPVANSTFIVH